jgi:hypothetical protein
MAPTTIIMNLSNLIASIAHIPYLDGYVFGTLCLVGTIATCAFVIDFIYQFDSK